MLLKHLGEDESVEEWPLKALTEDSIIYHIAEIVHDEESRVVWLKLEED